MSSVCALHTSTVAATPSAINRQVLVVLCGAQGSGKSTFCENLRQGAKLRWHRVNQVGIHLAAAHEPPEFGVDCYHWLELKCARGCRTMHIQCLLYVQDTIKRDDLLPAELQGKSGTR